MIFACIACGIAGFAALVLPDLCRLRRRPRLAAACSVFGYTAVLTALLLQAISFQPSGPPALRAAAAVSAGVFALLLVYSVLLEIPLRRCRRAAPSSLYTSGTYRLCRHPGLLWFLLMQLSLNAIYLNPSFLLVSAVLSAGDVALVAAQDLYVFPLVFPDYGQYKLRVPFLVSWPRTG